jgi:hypothetical protein
MISVENHAKLSRAHFHGNDYFFDCGIRIPATQNMPVLNAALPAGYIYGNVKKYPLIGIVASNYRTYLHTPLRKF